MNKKHFTYLLIMILITLSSETLFMYKNRLEPSLSSSLAFAHADTKKQQVKPDLKKSLNNKKTVAVKPSNKKQANHSSSPLLVDWWKSGRTIFSVGTTALVTDIETGKIFMVERTMGTNHADAEALTTKDTKIIKSIWNGFSWARRPVILTIDDKKYSASMSAMPHAGLDSSPAYSVINNRSQGYGKGKNLDVIKKNGMDGHFDIHFLNSTRHKDGKKDPEHQAAVLEVAKNK
ncbi:hypothetical protein [Clostridium cylindrosporum]|uniref:Uncharacterized protein n=1 Tax=Clostridium cylindrosporum DSM 605 TaxID=1121307 RepID=A0A0J8G6L3_CLOCY|nr:hypothetical protein [Clostridium cylindrosporum]KMT23246.1 hypothetical protein CLCY_6c01270 [Clostridium cylindrosporum DSM 605]